MKRDIVLQILENNPRARDDDTLLYCLYAVEIGVLNVMNMDYFYETMRKIWPPKTISRTRALLQAEFRHLESSKQVARFRNIKQEEATITAGYSESSDKRYA